MPLIQRVLVPELMDDPKLDVSEHRLALAGLRRINYFSRTGPQLAAELIKIARQRQTNKLEVLDLGCGSGDIARTIAISASKKVALSICGWDISKTAIQTANLELEQCRSRSNSVTRDVLAKIRFEVIDAFQPPQQSFDVVYGCLFLHHFTNGQAIEKLRMMKSLARCSVVIDDLCRTRLGWWLAKLGCQLLSRSPVVHFDGPQSVRAAFSEAEVIRLADQAGLLGATIRHHWPERFLLRWDAKS